jgi:pro-apoptotic serine protease NMA111
MNGAGRSTRSTKRKAADSESPNHGPPSKRAVNGKAQPPSDDVEYLEYDGSDMGDSFDGQPHMYIGTPESLGEWQDTIQNVVRNVVAIRFCQTCSFDTDPALTSEATGFVVDAERG